MAVGDLTFDSVEDLFCTSLLDDFFLGLATSFPLADFDLILVTWESELFFLIFFCFVCFYDFRLWHNRKLLNPDIDNLIDNLGIRVLNMFVFNVLNTYWRM